VRYSPSRGSTSTLDHYTTPGRRDCRKSITTMASSDIWGSHPLGITAVGCVCVCERESVCVCVWGCKDGPRLGYII
jgi:hypothetical protein